MISMRGNKAVILDSDALIGLISPDDLLHKRCLRVSAYLVKYNFATLVPYAIVLEAATSLSRDRRLNRSDLAKQVLQKYKDASDQKVFDIDVGSLVNKLYNPKTSKKNTPFDHYVLALAKQNDIPFVFSFDTFYKRRGLRLIEEIVA